ncbi:MAG: Ig-like domain-containing protein, partial [Nitrososphaerota archaeon]|nr:Ig-like domain-containing protein [Nitrososphaerota archaeon]
ALHDVEVHLPSSNLPVGSVQPLVKINAGENSAVAWFQSTDIGGETIITATAKDYEASYSIMYVVGVVPNRLVVYSAPPTIPADGKPYETLIIELQDHLGRPTKATSDIPVYLSSSRTDVGRVEEIVYIRSGETFTLTKFYSTVLADSTNITASASGYSPGWRVISTVDPLPSRLRVYAYPKVIPADGKGHKIIRVELRDSLDIAPARAREDILITLSSSNLKVGSVDPTIVLRKGETFAEASFYAKDIEGETIITAHASGFTSNSTKIKTFLYPVSLKILVNGTEVSKAHNFKRSSTLSLNLIAKTYDQPIPDASVTWSSNVTGIFGEQKVTDPLGKAIAYFNPPIKGSASITATIMKAGFTKANVTVNLSFWEPRLKIDFVKVAKEVVVGSTIEAIVRVTDEGRPVKDVSLTWSPKLASLINASMFTDADGRGYAFFSSDVDGRSDITVIASKDRYLNGTSSTSITIKPRPLVLQLQVEKGAIKMGEALKITAIATSDGKPVDNVHLSWSASLGNLNTQISITDSNGRSHVIFVGESEAIKFSSDFATIDVRASKRGYAPAQSTTIIEIQPLAIHELLISPIFWQKMLIPIVTSVSLLAIGVLAFVYIRKRRVRMKELEEEMMEG